MCWFQFFYWANRQTDCLTDWQTDKTDYLTPWQMRALGNNYLNHKLTLHMTATTTWVPQDYSAACKTHLNRIPSEISTCTLWFCNVTSITVYIHDTTDSWQSGACTNRYTRWCLSSSQPARVLGYNVAMWKGITLLIWLLNICFIRHLDIP